MCVLGRGEGLSSHYSPASHDSLPTSSFPPFPLFLMGLSLIRLLLQPEIRNDMITLLSKHLLVPSDEKLEVALF